MQNTYFVTGGAGFIGSNFIKYMLTKHEDINIINFDSLTYAGNLENLKDVEGSSRYKFIKGDIADLDILEKIFEKNEIKYVVNFAAESHVDRSIKDPSIFAKTNFIGTTNLLSVCKKFWDIGDCVYKDGVKYLQVSTDEVYGSLGAEGFFYEDTPLCPHSPYSASKASADLMVKAYFDTFGLPVNITRCSNNYGPYQFPEKLIPLIISRALNLKDVPIYGDGLNVRDWLYVSDHCKALELVLKKAKIGEIYNIGGHNEKKNIDIANKVISYLNKNFNSNIDCNLIRYVKDRKGHDKRYAIDATKIEKDLGWKPKVKFEEGLKHTVDWYLNNSLWLKNVLSKEYVTYYKKMYEGRLD